MQRFSKSGRSRAAFCKAQGISRSTFDLWQRKLRSNQPAPQQSSVELLSSDGQIGGWSIEIELPDGTVARLGS
jgi:hypothetical protein